MKTAVSMLGTAARATRSLGAILIDGGQLTLLTDGKSRNSLGSWSKDGKLLAYSSTRRNGADTDLYVMDPRDPKTDRLVAEAMARLMPQQAEEERRKGWDQRRFDIDFDATGIAGTCPVTGELDLAARADVDGVAL